MADNNNKGISLEEIKKENVDLVSFCFLLIFNLGACTYCCRKCYWGSTCI